MPNNEIFAWKMHLKETLDCTEFMSVATQGEDGVWVCPVQFSYDHHLGLYAKSQPHSKHMKNIARNPHVSVAIFSTNRYPDREVSGIQLKGTAEILTDRAGVISAAVHHYGRNKPGVDAMTRIDEHIGEHPVWQFFKITPIEVWYLDTRFFDEVTEGRQEVPLDAWNNL